MSLKLAVGLCNISAEYAKTKHNVGKILLEKTFGAFTYNKFCGAYVASVMLFGKEIKLAYIDGYMNNSGLGVKKLLKFYKLNIAEVAVVYDEINLALAQVKLSKQKSAGGHNGVENIMQMCGNDFMRVRVGIGAKKYKDMPLADYVLSKFSDEEYTQLLNNVDLKNILKLIVQKDFDAAQNILNTKNLTEK